MLSLSSNIKTIFLDSSSLHVEDKISKYNVILSPALYWVQKVSLPVSSVKEAKKLLPSLFEDVVPAGNYRYSAIKNGDDFFIFAFEDSVILEELKRVGLSLSMVKNLYFAQSELSNIESASKINDTQALVLEDEIIIVVPLEWTTQHIWLEVSEVKLSKHHFMVESFSNIIDKKSLYFILGILLATLLLLVAQNLIKLRAVDSIELKKRELTQDYALKPTMFQNMAILKELKKIHAKGVHLRGHLSGILSIRLKEDESMELLKVKGKKLSISFSGVIKSRQTQILKEFKRKKSNPKESQSGNRWIVELSL